jgi:hypothetical protein
VHGRPRGLELILADWFYVANANRWRRAGDKAWNGGPGALPQARRTPGRRLEFRFRSSARQVWQPLAAEAFCIRSPGDRPPPDLAWLSPHYRPRPSRCRAPQLHAHSCRSAHGRSTPSIDFRAGKVAIRVEAVPEHGMATIWDADVLIGLPPRYLRTPEAARFLSLSGRTLEKHRTYGTGPTYRKRRSPAAWWGSRAGRGSGEYRTGGRCADL